MPCVYKKIRDGVLDGLMLFVRRFFYLCACDISSDLANQSLLIVAPHPDDDILGCGAVIARACENKQNVHVVIVTDGRASSPSKTLSQSDLIALRKKEAVHALSVLGCGRAISRSLVIWMAQLTKPMKNCEEICWSKLKRFGHK